MMHGMSLQLHSCSYMYKKFAAAKKFLHGLIFSSCTSESVPSGVAPAVNSSLPPSPLARKLAHAPTRGPGQATRTLVVAVAACGGKSAALAEEDTSRATAAALRVASLSPSASPALPISGDTAYQTPRWRGWPSSRIG